MSSTTPDRKICTDPRCGEPLADHIGGKPCVVGKAASAKSLHDLPIAGWAWREDGRDRRS